MKAPYRDYASFLADHFQGKMQKISVSGGFSCPNRDGTISTGGCSYCNNASFNPSYCRSGMTVSEQIEEGKRFFGHKYPDMRYLAYFQAYTSTHAATADTLLSLYAEALAADKVDGLIIGTRPDCVNPELLRRISSLGWCMMEYGAESSHDSTLRRVNRGHKWADTVRAVTDTAHTGMPVGLHLIMGLPGETRRMMLETVDRINDLPLDVVKFHQLQIIRGTRLEREFSAGAPDIHVFELEEYLDLCAEIVTRLRHDIAIERFVSQSPDSLLVAPRWGVKNYQFTNRLINLINGKENNI